MFIIISVILVLVDIMSEIYSNILINFHKMALGEQSEK